MTNTVETTLSTGFEDHDKNKPFFLLKCGLNEMLVISKLLSHVRVGMENGASAAAFKLIQAIGAGVDVDLYALSEETFDFKVTVESQFGGIAATVTGDDVCIDFADRVQQ